MTIDVDIVRIPLDVRALRFYAAAARMVDDDGNYALHHAMRRRWGATAPQPFHSVTGGPEPHVVGFVPRGTSLDTGPSDDPKVNAVFAGPPETFPMPHQGLAGDELAFRLRVRPTIRYGREVALAIEKSTGRRPPSELDVVAAESLRTGEPADPAAACRQWLERRFGDAAELTAFALRDRMPQKVLRSSHGPKGLVAVPGWTNVVSGNLVVRDEAAFARLVSDGVGRHAAFGYGMLMITHSHAARMRAAA